MAGNNVDLTLRLLFKDEASKGLQTLGKQMMGFVAGASLATFFTDSVKAAAEAEAAQRKYADAIARTSYASALSELQDYNSELSRATGYDDDLIAQGGAILSRFTTTADGLKEATAAAVDYAAATGKDVPAAADAIAKASMGSTRALKSLGINYKSTGNQAQDMANVVDLVNAKVGGTASMDTGERNLRALATAYEDLQEAVGESALPVLDEIVSAFQMNAEYIKVTTDAVSGLTQTLDGLFGSVPGGADNMMGLGKTVMDVGLAVESLFNPILPLINGFNALFGAEDEAADAGEDAGRSWGYAAGEAQDLTTATKDLKKALDSLGGNAMAVEDATTQLRDAYAAATDAAKENGKALSLATAAGRANRSALRDIAKAADEAATSYAEHGKSASFIRNKTQEARAAFIAAAKSMGATGAEARALADKYGLIPGKVKTRVEASGIEDAISNADLLLQRWREIVNMPTATLNAHFGVTNTVTTVHQTTTRSSLGLKRFAMPGGPNPITFSVEQPQPWQLAGAAISEVVAAAEWEKLEKRIRNLRRKLNEDLSKEDEKATRARLKALRQELRAREHDLAEDLRDQLADLREQQEEAAQAWIESLQDAVDQAREAESAALGALQDAQAAEAQALQAVNDLIAQRQQFKDAIAESFRSQASVTGFSFADIDALTGGRDAAQQALFDARRAYNRALGTTDEAEALERLNEAKKAAAAADTALAEGQAQNTPAGILASMQKKVGQVKSLATNLRKMRDMGYPAPIIQDILNQGIEGARLAEVLATADPGTVAQFQAMQNEVMAAGADLGELGYALAGSPMDAAITQAQAAYQAAAGATATAGSAYAAAQAGVAAAVAYMNQYVGANGELLQPIQVSLQVDGRTLVEVLQNYRRSVGGIPLGLG